MLVVVVTAAIKRLGRGLIRLLCRLGLGRLLLLLEEFGWVAVEEGTGHALKTLPNLPELAGDL